MRVVHREWATGLGSALREVELQLHGAVVGDREDHHRLGQSDEAAGVHGSASRCRGLQAEKLPLRRREFLVGQLALRVHGGERAESIDAVAAGGRVRRGGRPRGLANEQEDERHREADQDESVRGGRAGRSPGTGSRSRGPPRRCRCRHARCPADTPRHRPRRAEGRRERSRQDAARSIASGTSRMHGTIVRPHTETLLNSPTPPGPGCRSHVAPGVCWLPGQGDARGRAWQVPSKSSSTAWRARSRPALIGACSSRSARSWV